MSGPTAGCSWSSWMPHAYTSAAPAWMPLFVTGRLVVKMPPGCLAYGAGAPAVTFDSPRYASSDGIRSDGPEPGVAVTAPRTVRTPPGPTENVSLLGAAAKNPAGTASVAVTSAESPVVPCGLSVTLADESVSVVPLGVVAARLYVTLEEP